MPDHQHTFLFREGLWQAQGRYYDPSGAALPCEGEARIKHDQGVWRNNGLMRILTEQPIEFENNYEIVPFADDGEITTWRSMNPALDNLRGRYIIVFDSIISPWESENGEYWGSEFLVQSSDKIYHNRGFACRGSEKLSSWAVELVFQG